MKSVELIKNRILLPVKKGALIHFPRGHLITAGMLGNLLIVLLIFASLNQVEANRDSQELILSLPNSAILHSDATLEPQEQTVEPQIVNNDDLVPTSWLTETVRSGDNLSSIFQRVGLSNRSLYELMSANEAAEQLTQLHPGQQLSFMIENQQLGALRYQKDHLLRIDFHRVDGEFKDTETVFKPDIRIAYREATITHSLFLAGVDAGIEENLIMEIADIFGWDIDFALDIRANDKFKVLYEEQFLNGEKLKNGRILATEFTNQNKTYRAVRYTDSKGDSNFYTPEGHSMRKAFLRTPVDFGHISSHFDLRRKHPILNTIRAHKGTDYAAPRGTPIRASGDGKIVWTGTKGGYGRTVIIQHGQGYRTLYAHMDSYAKGLRNGERVKQGQRIGYVGTSGLATGPHLHYEFYVNDTVRNPVTVKLPKAEQVPEVELERFKQQTYAVVAQLDHYSQKTQVATATTGQSTNQ
jgi:murein DD-endopeptidase MepM/ murein hydrolase activator NlpD